jgi:hypothetical protein
MDFEATDGGGEAPIAPETVRKKTQVRNNIPEVISRMHKAGSDTKGPLRFLAFFAVKIKPQRPQRDF